MAKRHERTLSRQMAIQALYMSLVTGEGISDVVQGDCELPDQGNLPVYANRLLGGVASRQGDLDAKLAEASENWSVARMPLVDHAILLVATYEMLHVEEVPVSVCINEAVELAKAYGGEDESARFVNGILGRIARTYCAERIDEKDAESVMEQVVEA